MLLLINFFDFKVLKKAVIEQQQAAKITQTITTDQGAVVSLLWLCARCGFVVGVAVW